MTDRGLREALASALASAGADGSLGCEAVGALRNALSASDASVIVRLGTEPERLLPAFGTLPGAARAAVRAAIVEADRQRMRGYELGPLHDALIRSAWSLRFATQPVGARSGRLRSALHDVAEAVAFSVRSTPAWAIDTVQRWRQRREGLAGRAPKLLAMLRALGVEPRDLAAGWADGVPQIPAFRGYWHEPRARRTVGVVVGFDLLPGPDGRFWFIESNVSIAQRPERSALYERDPMVANLLAHARENDYRRLVILDNNADGIDPRTRTQYASGARELGLEISLVTRRSLPQARAAGPRSFGVPSSHESDVLTARFKTFAVALDHLLHHKRASIRALERYAAATPDANLLLPKTTLEPSVAGFDASSPFPNVVFKLPDLDATRGLAFLKARDAAHAAELAAIWLGGLRTRSLEQRLERVKRSGVDGLYQEFVAPRLVDGRHVYIVRAHVLIAPTGNRFLSAHRVVSGRSVPEQLAPGLVRDASPYLVNFSSGARYDLVPADEEEGVRAAALAAARGLAWAVRRSFETGPTG